MFDRFVSGSRPSWKRRAVLIASVGAHGVLAVGLLVAGLFHVAEIAPALAIVFVSAHEPPLQESQVKPMRRRQRAKAATTASTRPVVPPASPTVQPTPAVAPPANETSPSSENVGPGGGGGGSDDLDDTSGPAGGGSGGPGVSMPAPRARNVAPHQLDAQKIAGADPHLPEFVKVARRGLGDSAFAARICVDQSGSVSRVDVLSGIPGADEAIVAALRGWKYRAQPIPVCFVSRFVFDVQ